MSLSYVHKYAIVCYLVLFLVANAVADISLDYYFGEDKPLRTPGRILLVYCGSVDTRQRCYKKCGDNHVCISGRCFCVEVNIAPGEDEDILEAMFPGELLQSEQLSEEILQSAEATDELRLSIESPEELTQSLEIIPKNKDENVGSEVFFEYKEDLKKPRSFDSVSGHYFDGSGLRHHIAHFCPDLDEARRCIRKCMKLGLPAFCGKDHNCYCGHTYENAVEFPEEHLTGKQNGFSDLYEKYFGPQYPE